MIESNIFLKVRNYQIREIYKMKYTKLRINNTNILHFNISRGKFKGLRLNLESNQTTRPTKCIVKKSFFDTMQDSINNKIFIECFAGSGQMGFEALSMGAKRAIFFELDSNAYKNLASNINIFMQKTSKYYNNILESNKGSQDFKIDSKLDSKKTNIQAKMHNLDSQKLQNLKQNSNVDSIKNNIIESINIDFFQSLHILESLAQNITNIETLKIQTKNTESKIKNDIISTLQNKKILLYLDPPFLVRQGFCDIYDRIITFIESFSKNLQDSIDTIVIEMQSGINIASKIRDFECYKVSKFGKTSLVYYKNTQN